MKEYRAAVLVPEKHGLGESPFYDAARERLSWVDITAGKLCTLSGGRRECIDLREEAGAAIPLRTGEFLIAGKKSLWILRNGERLEIADMKGLYRDFQRSNDAKADPFGRVYFGSSVLDGDSHEACGNLYRYDRGKVDVVQPDTLISNGMAWSADRKTFFFSDSLYHAVFAYDYDPDTGDISGRREIFRIGGGVPDGMCIDTQDRLWVAVWGGRRIECRNPATGETEAVVHVPAEHVTSCCFWGKAMNQLFITTSGNGLRGEQDGYLFACEVDAEGTGTDYPAAE